MKLRVAGEFLDQFDNVDIAQNYVVNSIGDITTREGGFSNNFLIPLTAKNKTLLGTLEINDTSLKPYSRVSADLVDRGAVISTGYIKYQSVNESVLNATFFADNVNWFSLIKDKNIRDIDLSAYDHTWDYQTQRDAIVADKDDGYTYTLIDYGEFETDASSPFKVKSIQMFPLMFVHTIIECLFFDIGWKVAGDMIDHPLYKRMVIPFSSDLFGHSIAYAEDQTSTTAKTGVELVNLGASPLSLNFGGAPSFAPAVSGNYTITAYIDAEQVGGAADPLTIDIVRLPGPVVVATATNTNGVVPGFFDMTVIAETVAIDIATDTIEIRASTTGANSFNVLTDSTLDFALEREITVQGVELQMSALMPDISQTDFLNYIAQIFGAIPQSNANSKTVNWGLFNNIKDSEAVDWSRKIDLNKSQEINFTELLTDYASESIFTYKEDDNDTYLTDYLTSSGEVFGQGQFDIANDFITNKEIVYEAPFSSMMNRRSFDNRIYIPRIFWYDSGVRTFTMKAKIGILTKNIALADWFVAAKPVAPSLQISNTDDSARDSTLDLAFCWFSKEDDVLALDVYLDSLSFDQTQLTNANGLPLIDRFLKDYENILNEIKYLKAYLYLNEVDIASLDFDRRVYIDHFKSYFYISKINNYISGRLTECELVKIDG